MENSAMLALKSFFGEAKRLGLTSEQDVVDMIKEVRHKVCSAIVEDADVLITVA